MYEGVGRGRFGGNIGFGLRSAWLSGSVSGGQQEL